MDQDEFQDDFEDQVYEEKDEVDYPKSHQDAASKLEQALEERPSEDELTGVFKGQNRSSMSNVLSGVAHELEMQMTSDAISQALGNLEKHHEIGDRRGSLSNVLAATAHELEVSDQEVPLMGNN